MPAASVQPSPDPAASGGAPGRWILRRYVLSLVAVTLLFGTVAVLFYLLSVQNASLLEILNASGRQRMLSQQATVHVLRLAASENRMMAVDAQASLDRVLAELVGNHRRLLDAKGDLRRDEALRELYVGGPEALIPQVQAFTAALEDILQRPPRSVQDPRVEAVIERGQGPLLDALDRVVLGYQHAGEEGAGRLRALVMAALAGVVLILVVEAILVFRPMARRADRQLAELAATSAELRRARDTLGDRVAERTRELAAARDAAQRESEAKSRFLATVGHDLLQPVKALGMFVTALERARHDGSAPGQEVLVDLRGALASISALIKGLLDFSRAEHGLLNVARRPVPLAPLLEQLAAEYAPLAEHQGLRLRVVLCRAMVDSDPVLLERMIRNLIANALRYTARGGVLIGCRRHGTRMRLEVRDTGAGVPEADLPVIHEAFTRGAGIRNASADNHEALGLGLTIVAELAAILGHGTGVRSVEGRGSVFWLEMDLVRWRPGGDRPAEARPVSDAPTRTA